MEKKCTLLLALALALSLGASLMVQSSFEQGLEREKGRALDEQDLLKMGFETASVTYAIQDIALDEDTVLAIAEQLGQDRSLALFRSDGGRLYGAFSLPELFDPEATERALAVLQNGEARYLYVGGPVELGGQTYCLLCRTDISFLYTQREALLTSFLRIYGIVLGVSALLIFAFSALLARPVSRLARLSRRIAGGQYELRAPEGGSDEVAQFTRDFNRMTDALVAKLDELSVPEWTDHDRRAAGGLRGQLRPRAQDAAHLHHRLRGPAALPEPVQGAGFPLRQHHLQRGPQAGSSVHQAPGAHGRGP